MPAEPAPAGHHLAQVNVARLSAPIESPVLADFVTNLEPVNAAADSAPGFIWRLIDDEGADATSITAFEWDVDRSVESFGLIVNMSVWTDIDALSSFVYSEQHRAVMRRRREWFRPMAEAYLACWWIPAGTLPTTDDAEARVRLLRAHGPTPAAFTLRERFDPPQA